MLHVSQHLEARLRSGAHLLHALQVVDGVRAREEGVFARELAVAAIARVLDQVDVGSEATEPEAPLRVVECAEFIADSVAFEPPRGAVE